VDDTWNGRDKSFFFYREVMGNGFVDHLAVFICIQRLVLSWGLKSPFVFAGWGHGGPMWAPFIVSCRLHMCCLVYFNLHSLLCFGFKFLGFGILVFGF